MEKWSREVSVVLTDLVGNTGVSIDDLASNEEFISIIAQAAKAIRTTHLDERRTVLANAVKNSALPMISHDKQQLFVHIIEQLSPTHITVLQEIEKWHLKDENFDIDELKDHLPFTFRWQ